ncbi:hypothetical protein TUMEXPCC7403_14780 [Tumidithrix helvetica PCC 7403]|uniref:hypothetical protein n=1 Tax=Tumidithrix helvetica TaxID=3457545 RepID=UPI003C869207
MRLTVTLPEDPKTTLVEPIMETIPNAPDNSYSESIDSNADPELLEKLAKSNNAKIRQGVVSNPNTPVKVLLDLGGEFPAQLLVNPIFTLLLLENPDLLSDIPPKTVYSLVRQANCPLSFLVKLAENQSNEPLLLGMAMNPNLPNNILEKLIQSDNPNVSEAAKWHVSRVLDVNKNWDEIAQTAIAQTTKSISSVISTHKNANIVEIPLRALADAGGIPLSLFWEWHKNPDLRQVNYSAGRSPHTSTEILELLALSNDLRLKISLAANPSTPTSILDKLAQEQDLELKIALATNTSTPTSIFNKLAQEQDPKLKMALVANPSTPSSVLDKLAQSPDLKLKIAIAKNPQTSASTLEKLANTATSRDAIADILSNQLTDMQQKYRKKGATDLISDFLPLLFTSVATQVASPDTRREDLLTLLQSIAAHRNTPPYILEDMAWDKRIHNGSQIRVIAVSNPNFPLDLLRQLLRGSGDKYVAHACARNPQMPTEDLESIANYGESWIGTVAGHPNAPLKILEKAAQSTDPRHRLIVAQNPSTPTHLLKQIAQMPTLHSEKELHLRIAQNPSADADVLAYIASITQDDSIHLAISYHPNAPSPVLETISSTRKPTYYRNGKFVEELPIQSEESYQDQQKRSQVTSERLIANRLASEYQHKLERVLEEQSKSSLPLVRTIVLLNPQATAFCLETASRSLYWLDRYLVAKHPNTPDSIREQLTMDANRIVCESAKKVLKKNNKYVGIAHSTKPL